MIYCKKAFFAICILFGGILTSQAQPRPVIDPVHWRFEAVPAGKDEVKLVFTATLDEGWHIYSQHLEEGGPLPTKFIIDNSTGFKLLQSMQEESKPIKFYNDIFMIDIIWFDHEAVFTQTVKLNTPETIISGKVEFMACTEEMCLPPHEVKFSIPVNAKALSGNGQ